jgi:hypothetical protein
MIHSTARVLGLSVVILGVACTSSTGPSNLEKAVVGTYRLQTIRGATLPVPLFNQCSLGGAAPCSACSETAASGTLTLKDSPREFTVSLVSSAVCVDPLGKAPTQLLSHTITATTSWSESGSAAISFGGNNMNLLSGSISGSTLSTSFNWLNPDAGGQPAQVTAVFGK